MLLVCLANFEGCHWRPGPRAPGLKARSAAVLSGSKQAALSWATGLRSTSAQSPISLARLPQPAAINGQLASCVAFGWGSDTKHVSGNIKATTATGH